ncbi:MULTISPECIES: winged helix-turn-helix transcriptional regulator [Stenotrophomonas maltophilia group]|jgi:DNA-binding HxlR family transcriptional regulator|uniref:Transcriptional regulator n=1 Tax=Stenotrophomonas maltophilia TaxID=40324 RepID=A0A270NJC4_STEMA|nr:MULTISPECIES: helix-turn-helix domain-containing protein [Stenotrophomonas maltophilia group]MCU1202948.1 helix-turn-helix transcriptional regulator [Stenotrophomonas maltophilia]PAM72151.1 transcriptional regulator [Stenotrophomonas maltophilia]
MHADSPCPVARSADLLGDRWALLVIRDAFDGITRFGDFQRSLGAARNILSDRLRRLVEAGILQLRPASDGSVYQEYVLTAAGQELFPLLVALRQWGERHRFGMGEAHSQLIELATRRPLPYMQPLDAAGHALASGQTVVLKLV